MLLPNSRARCSLDPATDAISTLPKRRRFSACTFPMKPVPMRTVFCIFITRLVECDAKFGVGISKLRFLTKGCQDTFFFRRQSTAKAAQEPLHRSCNGVLADAGCGYGLCTRVLALGVGSERHRTIPHS